MAEVLVDAVDGAQEKTGARQVAERAPGPGRVEHGVAQRTGQIAEDRRAHEELTRLARQLRQHLVAEEVGDDAVVAPESFEGAIVVGLIE